MKIVVHKKYYDIVSKAFPDIEFYKTIEECPDAEAIIGEPFNFIKENLEELSDIRWLQSFRAGYDTLNLEYFRNRKIIFTNAKGIYSIPIAEDVVCKILMHNTNAFKYVENQKNHVWKSGYERRELCGQTAGIIGTGSIATEIAQRLQGFNVKIIGYKRSPVNKLPFFDEIVSGRKSLDYIMSASDYIIVTVDLNKETYHMINKDNLKLMKGSASIINIARGGVINQRDLAEALKNKEISYAGLDVFETEPLPEDDELWNLDNVYITPHTSGIVKNNVDRLCSLIINNIKKFVEGDQLINVIK